MAVASSASATEANRLTLSFCAFVSLFIAAACDCPSRERLLTYP